MKSLPKISVVTISYNQGLYLEECIRSVLDQNYPNVEYIVVDPGSTDDSRNILQKYSGRIQKIILEPDHGPADGLNKGFAQATGDIFYYLNSDDRLAPGSFMYVSEFFSTHPLTDILCGAIRIIDENGMASPRKRTSDLFRMADYAEGISTVGQQATFFRRIAFQKAGGFNADNRISWDGELLIDFALAGCQFETVRRVLGDFRIYSDSITGSSQYLEKMLRERRRLRNKMEHANVPLYSSVEGKIRKLLYKLNICRHLGYLLVR
jgi:glycosyltransferase involved in cell wall biosynthesis